MRPSDLCSAPLLLRALVRRGHGRRARRVILWSVLSGVSGVLFGCSGDTTNPVSLPPSQTFWALQLNQHAINLALTALPSHPLIDTVQLTATALNAVGVALPDVGSVQYRATDSTVTVDSSGRVTAHYTTTSTPVIASLTVNGVTLVDTAFVRVTPSPFPMPLATLSIQPMPLDLDSAKDAIDDAGASINSGNGNIPVYATIPTGNPATDSVCSNDIPCQLLVAFSSSNPMIAGISRQGVVHVNQQGIVGKTTFYATTWAYGTVKRDSLVYTIGYPIIPEIFGDNYRITDQGKTVQSFSTSLIVVGVGANVAFENNLNDSVDVIFSGSDTNFSFRFLNPQQLTKTAAGYRIFPWGMFAEPKMGYDFFYIVFPKAGTYTFHSTVLGTGGTIVVSPGP